MPRFTIITITLNAERYVRETLQSVADQQGSDFQHIVWDGGSHDDTLSIVHSFKHVTLLSGKDSGIADAMNRAALHAKGEFLLFLHADDMLAHAKVLQTADRFLSLHPQCLWMYGRVHLIDEKGEKMGSTRYERYSHKRLRKYNFISHPATFIAKNLFESSGGYRTDLRYCMDYDLWLRIASEVQPLSVATPLACFREHRFSLSTSEPLHVAQEAYQVRNRYVRNPIERLRSLRTLRKRKKHLFQKIEL